MMDASFCVATPEEALARFGKPGIFRAFSVQADANGKVTLRRRAA